MFCTISITVCKALAVSSSIRVAFCSVFAVRFGHHCELLTLQSFVVAVVVVVAAAVVH